MLRTQHYMKLPNTLLWVGTLMYIHEYVVAVNMLQKLMLPIAFSMLCKWICTPNCYKLDKI